MLQDLQLYSLQRPLFQIIEGEFSCTSGVKFIHYAPLHCIEDGEPTKSWKHYHYYLKQIPIESLPLQAGRRDRDGEGCALQGGEGSAAAVVVHLALPRRVGNLQIVF